LLQPFFTILGSSLLLGEALSLNTIGAAVLMMLVVAPRAQGAGGSG
jgi:drug/metabolite transporter (DMT)-like permease